MEPFIGQITMFGFTFPPRGWADCDGQLLSISQNTALFSLLGTTYGGDGRTTFGLPDLRGRVPMHTGSGPGLTQRNLGTKSGNETTVIGVSNMPAHSHLVTPRASVAEGDVHVPTNAFWAAGEQPTRPYASSDDANMAAITSSSVGSGTAMSNLQPFTTIRFCIALTGLFPSRN